MRSVIRVAVATAVTAAALTVVAQPASAGAPYKVTADISKPRITLGQSVTISGKVTGSTGLKGKSVTIQWISAAKENDSWHKIATTKLSSSGKFSKTVKPVDGGPTIFRVVKSASKGHAAGKGLTDALDVFQWQGLFQLKDVATFGDTSINGTLDRGALLVKEGSPASFATAEAGCEQFRGRVGVDFSSPAAYGSLTLADAFLAFFATYTVERVSDGRNVSITLDPSENLSFFADFPGSDTTSELAVVGGQALCNAPT